MRSQLFWALAGMAALVPAAATAQNRLEAGDVLVRVRGIAVVPNESSGPVTPAFPGATVGVTNAVMPEIDFTYMATDNIGFELILATTRHEISGRGTLAPVGKLASSWVLPPTLTVQYHFAPESRVRPYVGAGINYTIFYSESASSGLNAAIGNTRVQLDDSFGFALQAGVDIDIDDRFFANIDVKYVDMDTTARLTTGAAVNRVRVDVNPLIFGIGIGTRF